MADRPLRAFVCGHPIAHSRSPVIHGYWLRQHGIEGSYERRDVSPEQFADFVRGLSDGPFVGGNITIPHKETAYKLVEQCDTAAEAIGAVNTIWFEDGRLCGGNTDAYGFAANLDSVAPGWEGNGIATVLGAGGAARAIVQALQQREMQDIRVVNRTLSRAKVLSDRFDDGVSAHTLDALPELLSDTTLLINTTSMGMAGGPPLQIELSGLPDSATVSDIVYAPLITPLLRDAVDRGLKAVDGLGMLLHQAVPGFERWFGVKPEVTSELREIVLADLEKGH
ncbi:shikimate dehydrogenase [Chelativorans sp. YIM 93263]|uniref:shikimate dehydrogenase n=1 Tax=Chelativorans sp. YIM 93263 TaxID=2906648 RepID=UPI0023793D72|nr:shikimate dehydrogenase [Chelativorans sp. YIM 93263]